MTTFIITFRETLEAALIVGILFSIISVYSGKFKNNLYIIFGVIIGIIFSFVFAYFFNLFLGGFEGKTEKIYEGVLMFIAFIMISHLLIWSNKSSKNLKTKIKNKVEKVLFKKELWVLLIIAFVSVVREGVETVIFLNALDLSLNAKHMLLGISGIVLAIIFSFLLFFSLKKINISYIFRFTNILLLLIAGGLLAHSIVEFQGAGLMLTFIKPLFDLSGILSEKEGIGSFLKAMFSYDANPSLIAFTAYLSYIFGFSFVLYKINKRKISS